jgi:predicted metalloprotease with PDZ domain
MQYRISAPRPSTRLLEIELILEQVNDDHLELFLPSWRPGRYELGNFAKNIRNIAAFDGSERPLKMVKKSKDTWSVDSHEADKIVIRYNYYAAQPDAGSCWIDDSLIYINPVHCCLYAEDRLHLPCKIILETPTDWEVATGLIHKKENIYQATDYHQLVDCPLLAGASLQHKEYIVSDINFHIWFSGECRPDWNRIIPDFKKFTEIQLAMMQSFPAREYHFLILTLPYKFYHGVEHTNSTVLALGPGSALMSDELYTDLVGVASHELFHAWNIKTIRPAEMLPYNYQQENYSRLGWVYEGVTTYYGDLFLARSGFFNPDGYFNELNMRLQRHMDNYGRFNHSVAESSFDTWLDGYVPGIPHRKTSIYDEGCLIACMLDLFIRKNSSGKFSLDDVMRTLYKDFALQNHGYREKDVRLLTGHFSGADVGFIFDKLINGRESYLPLLQELLNDVGCYISQAPAKNIYESHYGFRVAPSGSSFVVTHVAPASPAETAGLSKDDELICINDVKAENNLNDLFKMFLEKEIVMEVFEMKKKKTVKLSMEVFEMKKKKTVKLSASDNIFYPICVVKLVDDISQDQKTAFTQWTGINI